MRLLASSKILLTLSIDSNRIFQSELSKLLSKAGVIFPLMSSRGRPSSPPPLDTVTESDAFTVLFGAEDVPCQKGASYSASRALRIAGFTSVRNPLISGPTNLCNTPISLMVEFRVAAALDCKPMSLQKSIKSCFFRCETPKSSIAVTIHSKPSLKTLGFLCSFMILKSYTKTNPGPTASQKVVRHFMD
nr:hypothetical protein Iba_scaffold16259CG0150 [Ipomoea batatas]